MDVSKNIFNVPIGLKVKILKVIENVNPKATALEPSIYLEGIEHVFVNGGHVVDNSEHTGIRSGKVLRRD